MKRKEVYRPRINYRYVARTPEERFWGMVDKTEDCWNWLGRLAGGYGMIWFIDGTHEMAHRFSYRLHGGTIPDGLVIDHLCRNTACVNPEHLEAVTRKENARRGLRGILKSNLCRRGHELSEDNVYKSTHADGRVQRACKICKKAADARRRALKANAT